MATIDQRGLASCIALGLLGACASSPGSSGMPAWVESRQHPEYPDGAYLIGIGTASNPDRDAAYRQARDRAVADISGQLETHIRSEVTSYVAESVHVEGGQTAESLSEQVSSNVEAATSASLNAIRPVEQSYDDVTGMAASLVVIKRTDFAMQTKRQLEEIDGRVAALESEAEELAAADKLFQAARRYREIEDLLVKRAALEAQALFVWPAQPRSKPDVGLTDAFAKRRGAAGRVQLVLLCRHERFGERGKTAQVEQQFLPPFAALGIAVQPGTKEALARWDDVAYLRQAFGDVDGQSLVFVCDVTTTSRPAGHADLVGVRSSGSARLFDAKSGELLLTATYSPDASGDTPAIGSPERVDSLVDRALAHLAERLAARVLEQI